MFTVRTGKAVKMNGAAIWLAAAALQVLLLPAKCGHHRRSMPTQATLPASKGGWRPVIGSGGLLYGFNTAPLHAPPAYKLPIPVIDSYASSARPVVTRDAAKLTSIAQSYHPTTLRTISPAPPAQPANQPINSYHNPFTLTNNGLTHYKYVQNFPVDSVLIRNPHNHYAARPVFTKYPTKFKQHQLQQLTNIQPVQFGQYPTSKPLDVFGRPIEVYKKPSSGTEIFKPEVYKLPDSDTASQSLNQRVKTAQQQGLTGTTKIPLNPYPQYPFYDTGLPQNILGAFGSFGVQSAKGRDPVFPTKSTYVSSQPNKQTIFNSFNYSPNFKTTSQFSTTTPKFQTTANQIIHFGSAYNNYKNVPTQQPKIPTPQKVDPNVGYKSTFRPSPQDPFTKNYHDIDYKVSTYNPGVQTTTVSNNFYHDYSYPSQQNVQLQQYYEQQNIDNSYVKKHKIQDNFASDINKQTLSQQYVYPPSGKLEATQNSVPHRATYEVTENYESDDSVTSSSPIVWSVTSDTYDYGNLKSTEESVTKQEYHGTTFGKLTTTPLPNVPDEYAIVTEAEKGYANSLSYDNPVESQSRRPLSDDFEPIGKHKLKDYYYKVTPTYEEQSTVKRTKKPTESSRFSTQPDVTTHYSVNKETSNDIPVEALPTLPPNKHFKRPNTQDTVEKEKTRKRLKNRRRRPPQGNGNRDKEETSTKIYIQSSTEPSLTIETEEVYTYRPRVRPAKLKSQPTLTTPSITTDLTTSALPTISPTTPTLVKKKLVHRRPLTTPANFETTTESLRDYDLNKESPIMKIASSARPNLPKFSVTPYGYNETPDYTHKQDEKDTPTSDIAVSLSDTFKSRSPNKGFSFHRDVKPIDAKLEAVSNLATETTTASLKDSSVAVTNEITTATPYVEAISEGNKRSRIKNKFESNRPRFSVKDYRNRLSSTTSTTEKAGDSNTSKMRFPQRRVPYNDNKYNSEIENTTERRKFTPKEPRHKPVNGTEISEQTEKEIHSIRQSVRQRQTAADVSEGVTSKISTRVRNGSRRPRPTTTTEEITTPVPTTVHSKRPLRKKIKDAAIEELVQDISITETTPYERREETSERTRSESAIMKIADKKNHAYDNIFEHSKRVSDLTLAASKDYNTPGMFKTVSSNSRRIPNYFTIATDDPILPIEAFFPQLNQKKESLLGRGLLVSLLLLPDVSGIRQFENKELTGKGNERGVGKETWFTPHDYYYLHLL